MNKKSDFTLDWNRNNKMLIKLKNKIDPKLQKIGNLKLGMNWNDFKTTSLLSGREFL